MESTVNYAQTKTAQSLAVGRSRWQWIILLIILAYESLGCFLGGGLLIAAPDGRYLDMPVEIMRGFFRDFLIPGLILIGLGFLNAFAFVSVLRRTSYDWIIACMAMGGMLIWFVVEIIILHQLHWLHLMWGVPVLLGGILTIPLIVLRHDTVTMRKALLTCGILSSLWYIAINIFVPMRWYEGYNIFSQAPSELSAIDAPTRLLWVLLCSLYPLLFAAFGWGVHSVAGNSRSLQITGILIIIYCIINLYWPPMHRREVLATGGGTLTDTLHIVWAVITLAFMTAIMGFGAASQGRGFRIYTLITFVAFITFGLLTFNQASGMSANLPTPWMGLWERINIAAFMFWIMVFARLLLHLVHRTFKPG